MAEEKRKPWMKWYPSDWRGDPKLRMCGLAARGLWAEVCMLMHEAEPYGHLVINGVVPTPAKLANLVGAAEVEVAALLAELKAAGVCSVTAEDIVFSRRMVRDRRRSEEGAESAARRWGDAGTNGQPTGGPNGSGCGLSITPEARGHKPEYKFTGRVIRLTAETYDSWRSVYKNLDDLDALLVSRDVWLASADGEAARRRWFHSTAAYLARVNADRGEGRKSSRTSARAPI